MGLPKKGARAPLTLMWCFRAQSDGMDAEEGRWRVPSLFWLPLVVGGGLLFMVDVFQLQYYSMPGRLPSFDLEITKGFLIRTRGCRIPFMDPFDASILDCIEPPSNFTCNKGAPALFDSNMTSVFLVESALEAYGGPEGLQCCYRPFKRRNSKPSENDDKVKFGDSCITIKGSAKIEDEFVRVTCRRGNETIYRDFFSFVPLKNLKKPVKDKLPPMNVLIVGLDAVSRVNFHRQMPKTAAYLANISAVELLGYNKVADNTFPNLVPVLTGLSEDDLSKLCWKKEDAKFDGCPFIWKEYKNRSFVTSFAEDASWMGIFNYVKKGFRRQPTDYSWGIFNRIAEKVIGNSHNMNVEQCVGARPVYITFLEYIKRFVQRMDAEGLPYFSFNWGASLSHDYLNQPKLGDEYYLEFFKFLKEHHHLDNTALIFMSDHGIRWGKIRSTYQGRMEERLPFVFMVLPEWYKLRYPQAVSNLLKNRQRLTTPFDLHEVLVDFLDPYTLETRATNESRAFSLFDSISPDRTCESANISAHWCTCQTSLEVAKNDTVVLASAKYAVTHMNKLLQGYAQCANLSLSEVKDARLMSHSNDIAKSEKFFQDYMITLQTTPGDGLFEVTVRRAASSKDIFRYEVTGTISRLNLYGKQSACVTDFHLKLYCYCNSLL